MIQIYSKSPTDSFSKDLVSYLKTDLEAIEEKISVECSEVSLINKVSNHLLVSGGKRLRPILLLLCARLAQSSSAHLINLAVAIELVHTATLFHDDVVDEGELRRNKPCARLLWGNKTSILTGDYLFSLAFHKMIEAQSLPILKIITKSACDMAEGEMIQLTHVGNLSLPEDIYFDIIRLKTASLFSAACRIGSLMGDDVHGDALKSYGQHLGIIFQLVDDLLDYNMQDNTTGKTLGNDLQERKITFPLIRLYQQASETEKKALQVIFQEDVISKQDQQWIIHLMKQYNIQQQAIESINNHALIAKKSLTHLPERTPKSFLLRLIDFCIQRIN